MAMRNSGPLRNEPLIKTIHMPASKVMPAPGDAAAPNRKNLTKLWQALEPLMTEALSACVLEEPDDPLGFVIERLSAAHQRGLSVAPAATKPKDTPAKAALRAKVETALKPLQQAQQTDAAGEKHALPESLQNFTTLAEEKDIIEVAEPLRALEAAVAREPDSKEAAAALDAGLKKLIKVTKAKIESRADKAELEALLTECEAAISAGNRDFERVYRAVWAVLLSSEAHLLPRFEKAVGALLECIKRPDDKPLQRKEAKDPTTLLVDAAHTKPKFEAVAEQLATLGSGTRLEMQHVGDKDKHGHETSGLKKLQRVVEKALLKPASDATVGETDSVLDVVRAMIVVKDFGVVAAIVEGLKALSDAELVDVLRLKNRFESPSAGGWRDLMINLVIVGDERQHVCEIQIVHEMMLTARKGLPGVRAVTAAGPCALPVATRCAASTRAPASIPLPLLPVCLHVCAAPCAPARDAQHEVYAKVRTASELVERLGKERELRRTAVAKLRADGATEAEVVAVSEDAWLIDDAEWVRCFGDRAQLSTKVKADEEGRVVKVYLFKCSHMKALPASVGKLRALQKLNLTVCRGLTSLPAELGQLQALTELNLTVCEGLTSLPAELGQLQALTQLNLESCSGLTSLPDLSGLKVKNLPEKLQPWEEGGRKAFALPPQA